MRSFLLDRAVRGALVGVVLCGAVTAHAGHYDLSSVGWANDATLKRLARVGVETTQDLWDATRTPKAIARLARQSGVPASRLQEWHRFCDLLFIDGVGPKVARVLTEAGVRDRRDLARQDPEELVSRIRDVNERIPVLGKLPDTDSVRSWVDQARQQVRQMPPAESP